MITREQAIAIAEDYFNGDFKANYCEHRFEYAESEKRWYGIVYLHEPDWSNQLRLWYRIYFVLWLLRTITHQYL